jgi:hypothetical protein
MNAHRDNPLKFKLKLRGRALVEPVNVIRLHRILTLPPAAERNPPLGTASSRGWRHAARCLAHEIPGHACSHPSNLGSVAVSAGSSNDAAEQ